MLILHSGKLPFFSFFFLNSHYKKRIKARESNLGEQKREIREVKSWLTPGISDADISHNDKMQYQTTGHGPEES